MPNEQFLTQRAQREKRLKDRTKAANLILEQFGLGQYAKKRRPKRRAAKPAPAEVLEPKMKSVYVIGTGLGPVKIGIAADVTARLRKLQTGHPEKLHVLFQAPSPDAAEIEYVSHRLLAGARLSGEWFSVTVEQAIWAIRTAADG